jgi:hypothetical protein
MSLTFREELKRIAAGMAYGTLDDLLECAAINEA